MNTYPSPSIRNEQIGRSRRKSRIQTAAILLAVALLSGSLAVVYGWARLGIGGRLTERDLARMIGQPLESVETGLGLPERHEHDDSDDWEYIYMLGTYGGLGIPSYRALLLNTDEVGNISEAQFLYID